MAIERRKFLSGALATSIASTSGLVGLLSPAARSESSGSIPITGVKIGRISKLEDNQGDTWAAAWAADDNLYTPSDDTSAFHKACSSNVAFNRLDGDDPFHLKGTTINPMAEYGKEGQLGPDGCNWKSTGCIWIDGALYLAVSRHLYGDDSGDLRKRQTAENGSIIRSTDFGRTWTPTAQQNYENPMFPGRRFATPYFIQYGYGHREVTEDGASEFVYATSNNGFWDCGDDMVLGRVARSRLGLLNSKDWEYYTGGNGMEASAWSPKMSKAKRLIVAPGRFGMTGAVYLAGFRRYFMVGWYYPAGGGKIAGAGSHTVWDFYESPKPWGPWTRIGSYDSVPDGWYSPEICPKFQTGNRVIAVTAGYWEHPESYRLTIVELELET